MRTTRGSDAPDERGPTRIDIIDIRDRGYAKRFALALGAAVAVHEAVAGLWPRRPQPPPPDTVVAQVVTIAKRTPAPTPPPTPRPTPTPVPTPPPTPEPHYTLAPKIVVRAPAARAAATPRAHVGGAAAVVHVVRATPPPRRVVAHAPARSLASGTAAGEQRGGSGSGAGAGEGNGGLGGAGSGAGTAGQGNAGDVATAPCGEVTFEPGHLSYRRDGTAVQTVFAKVVLRDGTVSIGLFPYPFTYATERSNPFLHEDMTVGPDHRILLQPPPPDLSVDAMPPAVQVVIKHSDLQTGKTTLPECGPTGA